MKISFLGERGVFGKEINTYIYTCIYMWIYKEREREGKKGLIGGLHDPRVRDLEGDSFPPPPPQKVNGGMRWRGERGDQRKSRFGKRKKKKGGLAVGFFK